MTRATLDRVASLVHAGATVLGPKPAASPTLRNFPADDAAVRDEANALWQSSDSASDAPIHGGVAVSGSTVEQILARMKIEPDATFSASGGLPPKIVWIHRTIGDADVYFIGNQAARSADVDCSLRITGRVPQLWHAESGLIEPAPVWHEDRGRTVITVHFDQAGSVFIVLRPGTAPDHALSVRGPGASAIHAPKIDIAKARYEAVDGSGGVDVTDRVAAMVAAGATEIAANNDSFGDPTYNHVKRLHVEYRIDGAGFIRASRTDGLSRRRLRGSDRSRRPAHRACGERARSGGTRRPMGGGFSARPRRSSVDHARCPRVVDGQRGHGREVLLGDRDVRQGL
jgi:hypothetical protein